MAIMAVMFVYTFCKKDLGQAVRTTALSRKETAWGFKPEDVVLVE